MAQPKEVKMLSFNDNLSPALLTKLNFKVIYNVIINPDVDSLPEKAKLLQLGPIDFFIGGASRDGKQGDSLNRHLFECYRIITVLSEGNSELQWIFYAPLDASQEFIETANRFFVCKGEMLKTRITREQYLLWSNMSSLKEMTTEVIL
ncbi:uncharacterized protein [Anabrus simplex]|uniref:uncharacterized protein n=1 Tax=Anabrus simplex TaxID=316456 RepID=UPI0034DCF1C9